MHQWLHCVRRRRVIGFRSAEYGAKLPAFPGSAGALKRTPSGAALLRPAADDVLRSYPVSRGVNAVRNNGPELIHPIAAAPPAHQQRDTGTQLSLVLDQ